MKLTLFRTDGVTMDDGRRVWGASVDEDGGSGPSDTMVFVPGEIVALLSRQTAAPRNVGATFHDLVEQAAQRAAEKRGWRERINLTNEDLIF